jgi:hypothetical protein
VQQLRGASAADTGGDDFTVGVGRFHRGDDLFLDLGDILRIDAALERTSSPQTEGIRPFVVVRAGNEDVAEARQTLADAFDLWMKETDKIDGDDGNLFLTLLQDDSAGLETIVNTNRLAIVTEAGHENGFFLHARSDVRFREAGLQFVVTGCGAWSIGREKRQRRENKQEDDKVA